MEPLSKKALKYAALVRWNASGARRYAWHGFGEYATQTRLHALAARMAATNARKEGWHGTFV